MPLLCPKCPDGHITIDLGIELEAPGIYQECQLQVASCGTCEFRGPAVYLESRAGRLDSEIVHHFVYDAGPDATDVVEEAILSCPDRRSRRCDCVSHADLVGFYRLGEPGFEFGTAEMFSDPARRRPRRLTWVPEKR